MRQKMYEELLARYNSYHGPSDADESEESDKEDFLVNFCPFR